MEAGRRAEDIAAAQQDYASERREAAEQREMDRQSGTADSSRHAMGAGRPAEDIASARQDYEADREAAQQAKADAHHGRSTGLEQEQPYTAGAEAGGLLSKEDIQEMDRQMGTGPYATSNGAVDLSQSAQLGVGPPQITGDPGTGFTSSSGPGSGSGLRGSMGGSISSGQPGVVPTPTSKNEWENAIRGQHNTMMGKALDPHLK